MAANVPQFTSGMTDDQVKQAVNAYEQAAGLPPSDASQWIGYYHQFGANDPNYFTTRLLNGIATDQHGNMAAFQDTMSPTAAGGWGPGTSGYGGGAPAGGGSAPGGGFSFTPQDVASDPGYKFALTQDMNAILANKAAQGVVAGTGTQKDLIDYATGKAYEGENQLFNQNLQTFQTNFNNLGQLVGTGTGAIGAQQGYLTSGAAAQAAGQVGAANQWTGGLSDFGNALQNQQLYKMFNPASSTTAGQPSGGTYTAAQFAPYWGQTPHPMGPYQPGTVPGGGGA